MWYSNVLHCSVEAVNLDDELQKVWGSRCRTHDLALAMVQRIWLCQLRLVSTAWRNAGKQFRLDLADVKLICTLSGRHTALLLTPRNAITPNSLIKPNRNSSLRHRHVLRTSTGPVIPPLTLVSRAD